MYKVNNICYIICKYGHRIDTILSISWYGCCINNKKLQNEFPTTVINNM